MPSGIDRGSPVPFYHQLKAILSAEIEQDGLQAGARMSGDHALCRRFDERRLGPNLIALASPPRHARASVAVSEELDFASGQNGCWF